MIPVPASTRVWLAAGVTDMRNYAEQMIMRGRWQLRLCHQRLGVCLTPHNFSCGGLP